MKNTTLKDLNIVLFEQIALLNDHNITGEELEEELMSLIGVKGILEVISDWLNKRGDSNGRD